MVRAVTRRNFLEAVGVTGGAGVLYGAMGALGLAPTAAAATGEISTAAARGFLVNR